MTVAHLLKISQAPGPAVAAGFDFVFAFPSPIKFRGKMLQDAQVRRRSRHVLQKYSILSDHHCIAACSLDLDE
jgi:hypothetical protein